MENANICQRKLHSIELLDIVQYLIGEYFAGRVSVTVSPDQKTEMHRFEPMLADIDTSKGLDSRPALEVLKNLSFTTSTLSREVGLTMLFYLEFTYARRL